MDIIVLRYYDQPSLTEVTERLGTSCGAVKLRHLKAILLPNTALMT